MMTTSYDPPEAAPRFAPTTRNGLVNLDRITWIEHIHVSRHDGPLDEEMGEGTPSEWTVPVHIIGERGAFHIGPFCLHGQAEQWLADHFPAIPLFRDS